MSSIAHSPAATRIAIRPNRSHLWLNPQCALLERAYGRITAAFDGKRLETAERAPMFVYIGTYTQPQRDVEGIVVCRFDVATGALPLEN